MYRITPFASTARSLDPPQTANDPPRSRERTPSARQQRRWAIPRAGYGVCRPEEALKAQPVLTAPGVIGTSVVSQNVRIDTITASLSYSQSFVYSETVLSFS